MARVPKVHFEEPHQLAYDVFVRLGPDHFVQIARTGVMSQIHRLRAFETDLVPWFYVMQGDLPRYVEQTVSKATFLSLAGAERSHLLNALARALEAVQELVQIGGFGPSAWEATKGLADVVQGVALTQPGLPVLLNEMRRLGSLTFRHSVGVATIATLIAQEKGLAGEDLKMVAAAGLLHDIGLMRVPEEVLSKRLELMNENELKSYRSHAFEGAKLLKDCSQVPSEVVQLVYEHHECGEGAGYPRGLPLSKQRRETPMVALAERFCELTLGDAQHQDFLSPQAAINTIANVEGHPFPMDLMKILEKFLHQPS